jgi:hypothetical protein
LVGAAAATPATGKGGKGKKKSGGLLGQLGIDTSALKNGDIGGFVQQNSNSTTGANAVTKLDKPSNNVGAQLDAAFGKYGNQPSPAPTAQASAQGGGGASCLAGTFQRRICGNSNMTAEVAFSGGQRGTGYFQDQDCAMVCPQGRRFDFNYSINGDGTMRIDYTGGQICGVPKTPNGGNQPFSCNGSALRQRLPEGALSDAQGFTPPRSGPRAGRGRRWRRGAGRCAQAPAQAAG